MTAGMVSPTTGPLSIALTVTLVPRARVPDRVFPTTVAPVVLTGRAVRTAPEAVPAVPAPARPTTGLTYVKLVVFGTVRTTNVPLYPATLALAMVTIWPTAN